MRINLSPSVELILKHEGGYVDDPRDPGGCTNHGITLATYRRFINPAATCRDVEYMSSAEAETIYENTYWPAVKADALPPGVDLSVFDHGVNAGPRRASKLLQGVVGVARDGIIGPMTLNAVWNEDGEILIVDYAQARLRYYRSLRHWDRFGRGWSRRTEETESVALGMHETQRPVIESRDERIEGMND